MRTEEGTTAALGGLYPGASLYMDCDWVADHKPTVQKLANAFVRTLQFIDTHTAAEIAAEMPPEFAGGDPQLYEQAIGDSMTMFTADGVMPADGPANVLEILATFNPSVQAKTGQHRPVRRPTPPSSSTTSRRPRPTSRRPEARRGEQTP